MEAGSRPVLISTQSETGYRWLYDRHVRNSDNEYDAYIHHNIEHLFPTDVPVALSEFRRVLKPTGILVLIRPTTVSVRISGC